MRGGAPARGRPLAALLTRPRGYPGGGADWSRKMPARTRRAQLWPRPTCPQKRVIFMHACRGHDGPASRAVIGRVVSLCTFLHPGYAASAILDRYVRDARL